MARPTRCPRPAWAALTKSQGLGGLTEMLIFSRVWSLEAWGQGTVGSGSRGGLSSWPADGPPSGYVLTRPFLGVCRGEREMGGERDKEGEREGGSGGEMRSISLLFLFAPGLS